MSMDLVAKARLNVLGVSRYEFEGNRGLKVFTQKDSDGMNPDVAGIEVVEFGGDYPLFEDMRGYNFPMEFDCDITFRRGARGKSSPYILKVSPIKPTASKPVSATA